MNKYDVRVLYPGQDRDENIIVGIEALSYRDAERLAKQYIKRNHPELTGYEVRAIKDKCY